jgi:hypothetical protein
MATLARPGSYVSEVDFPTYTSVSLAGSTATFIGSNKQGPLSPQLVQSWAQYVALYGNFDGVTVPSDLALAVFEYFANGGGGPVYVLRVVHTDAVAAAQFALDSSTDSTLTLTAANPGAWGNNIYVDVVLGTNGTFNLLVHLNSDATNTIVERWTGLSMNQASSYYVAQVLNNPLQGSAYINVTDLEGTPTVPGNMPIAGTYQLGTGAGSVPGADGSAINDSDLAATTTQLDTIYTPMVINLPGVIDITALDNMISYCDSGRDVLDSVVVVDPPQAQSPSAMEAFDAELGNSSYAFIYYPWMVVQDPSSTVSGALRTIAPGAFAMAQISATDANRGVWKAPAGIGTTLSTVLSTEINLASSDLDTLNLANINVIRYVKGSGICIMGARTMSNQQNLMYVNVRRALIYIESSLLALTQYAAFEDNDYILRNALTSRCQTFLSQVWASGGLAGSTAADAFYVTCDSTNNTPTTIAQGQVVIEVGVAPQKPAEFVVITVGQWAGGSSVSESSTANTVAVS